MKSSTRPTVVKIIGKTYGIAYAIGKPLDDGNLRELDHEKQSITIRIGQPLEQEQDTILHEILHGVDHELFLKMSEKQVRGMTTGLLAVLKDNPKVSSYLRRRK